MWKGDYGSNVMHSLKSYALMSRFIENVFIMGLKRAKDDSNEKEVVTESDDNEVEIRNRNRKNLC